MIVNNTTDSNIKLAKPNFSKGRIDSILFWKDWVFYF